jgi:hypothetical protein
VLLVTMISLPELSPGTPVTSRGYTEDIGVLVQDADLERTSAIDGELNCMLGLGTALKLDTTTKSPWRHEFESPESPRPAYTSALYLSHKEMGVIAKNEQMDRVRAVVDGMRLTQTRGQPPDVPSLTEAYELDPRPQAAGNYFMRTAYMPPKVLAQQEKTLQLHDLSGNCSINGDRGVAPRRYPVQPGPTGTPCIMMRHVPRPPPPTF